MVFLSFLLISTLNLSLEALYFSVNFFPLVRICIGLNSSVGRGVGVLWLKLDVCPSSERISPVLIGWFRSLEATKGLESIFSELWISLSGLVALFRLLALVFFAIVDLGLILSGV